MPWSRNQRAAARADVLVEGPDLGAGEVEPAADALDQVAGHDPRGLHPEVGVAVAVGHGLPGDLEHRLVALGGEEAEPVDLALEQLVGGDGGAVADRRDRVTVAGGQAQQPEHLVDAGHEAVGGVARRRGGLGGDQLAGVLVEGDDVGERAAGVDADPDPSRVGGAMAHIQSRPPAPGPRHNVPTGRRFVGRSCQRRRRFPRLAGNLAVSRDPGRQARIPAVTGGQVVGRSL